VTANPIKRPEEKYELKNMFSAIATEEDEDDEIPMNQYEEPEEQKAHVRRRWSEKRKTVQLAPLIAEPTQSHVNSITGKSWLHVDPQTQWRRIRSVMDSGCSESCAPPELAPEIQVRESEGSRRGQTYSGAVAGGRTLENMGEKEVNMFTGDGVQATGVWQMLDVQRPLSSVRQVCLQGNRVIFGMYGGVVQNIHTGEEIPFDVEENIYTMDLWMPPEDEASWSPGFAG